MYSWKELLIKKIKKMGKENPEKKQLARVLLRVILFFFSILEYLEGNVKRIACLPVIWLFFVASCSFAFPQVIIPAEVSTVNEAIVPADVQSKEIDAILAGDEFAILDDSDVMNDTYDEELENISVDLYSADDILAQIDDGYKFSTPTQETEKKVSLSQLDENDWRLILINKQHPVPDNYTFTLGTIQGNMQCDARILDDLYTMLQGAKDDGISLVICSPYRDYNKQMILFNRKIKAYIGKGLSYAEAYSVASTHVTVPGASEHQIGLALDIVSTTHYTLNYAFGDSPAGKWLANNSYKYGFTLRYPEGFSNITGIIYEPWHFRYVGVEAATYMKQNNITLEELIAQLEMN